MGSSSKPHMGCFPAATDQLVPDHPAEPPSFGDGWTLAGRTLAGRTLAGGTSGRRRGPHSAAGARLDASETETGTRAARSSPGTGDWRAAGGRCAILVRLGAALAPRAGSGVSHTGRTKPAA